MTPQPQDITYYNNLFDMLTQHMLEDIYAYKKILLQQILKTDTKNIVADRDFMDDMAKRGFINSVKLHIQEKEELQKAYSSLIQQAKDILDLE